MAVTLHANVMALNAVRNLSSNQAQQSKAMASMSSGLRIAVAADDAAGLVISEKMRSEIGGSKQALRNVQDAISVVQTTEGALAEVHAMLQRMRDLAVQGLNTAVNGGPESPEDSPVGALRKEVAALTAGINLLSSRTTFNGRPLLAGGPDLTFWTGSQQGDSTSIALPSIDSASLGIDFVYCPNHGFGGPCGNRGNDSALISIDAAIQSVSAYRGALGAHQNRFEHTASSLNVKIENLMESESRIRDADVGEMAVELSRTQITTQAATAMLAQASQMPRSVLSLLPAP